MEIALANPRGFCAGVDRAIAIVERALELFGPPIYVRHEVVHNRFVVEDLRQRGAVFVDELDEVPDDATVIFSAHGVPRSVEEEAEHRRLKVFDATCPLVTKVHLEVVRHAKANREVVLIGHEGHPEVEGTKGRYDNPLGGIYVVGSEKDAHRLEVKNPEELAFVTQTTLSVDDAAQIIAVLKEKFPSIQGPRKDDICYATQNRQDAVKVLAAKCDLVIVVGSPNSSNSNRLRELAEKQGKEAYLVDGPDDIDGSWLKGRSVIGITAGASAPEVLVKGVVDRILENCKGAATEIVGVDENMEFPLPRSLQ